MSARQYFRSRPPEGFLVAIALKTPDGLSALDVTGWSFAAEAVDAEGDAVELATYTVTVTNASTGQLEISLDAAVILTLSPVVMYGNLIGTPPTGSAEEMLIFTHEIQASRTT